MSAWSPKALPDLTEAEFRVWLDLLEQRTGISFENHRAILQAGLKQRMSEVGSDSFDKYYRFVTVGKQAAAEWAALLRTLTVKETRFFRDEDALEFVQKYLLELLKNKKDNKSIELWSVACSTGEEPYTLAMQTNDVLQGVGAKAFFGVTATDICLSSLAVARKGVYNNRRLQTLPQSMATRYFEPASGQQSQIVKSIKQRVCFVQANIIDLQSLPVNDMDIVYCQNVLIYFKRWRQKAVLDELAKRLKLGGILIVGMGEAVDWENNSVERIKDDAVQAYRKIA